MKNFNCSGKDEMTKTKALFIFILLFSGLFFLNGCASSRAERTDTGAIILGPPNVQVSETSLKPGLSVVYVSGFWRNLYQMPSDERAAKIGSKGEPIANLNHRFGQGQVFGSGKSKGVGLYMDGFIKFEKPGYYSFQARSNDGFRLTINGAKIIEDSSWHSDRLSKMENILVNEAGWYPMQVRYFQRKGTATIELYWKKPGDEEKSIVPAQAFAHAP